MPRMRILPTPGKVLCLKVDFTEHSNSVINLNRFGCVKPEAIEQEVDKLKVHYLEQQVDAHQAVLLAHITRKYFKRPLIEKKNLKQAVSRAIELNTDVETTVTVAIEIEIEAEIENVAATETVTTIEIVDAIVIAVTVAGMFVDGMIAEIETNSTHHIRY